MNQEFEDDLEKELHPSDYEGSYFIMITNDVLCDDRLSDFQKLLYGAISGLCKERGYCWATNSYLQKKLNKKETQVSTGISKLVELGYLKREIVFKKKEDKNGNIIETKEIKLRKLYIIIEPNSKLKTPENQNRGIPENQKYNIKEKKYNNTLLLHNNGGIENDNKNNKENEYDDVYDVLVSEDKVSSISPPAEEKKKGKGGLAPLIDEAQLKYPKEKYLELNQLLNYYLKAHIGNRRLPNLEKWKEMLNNLENYSSITLPGTIGNKFNVKIAELIVEKALNGKDGSPFLEFDDIYGYGKNNLNVKEPQFNLNQDYTKGY